MNFSSIIGKLKSAKVGKGVGIKITPQAVVTIGAVLIVLADVWVAQAAVRAVYQYQFADVGAKSVQSTRINFEAYNKAVGRMENAENYNAISIPTVNPFKEVTRLPDAK